MTKPKPYHTGTLRVTSQNTKAMDWALRGRISEGQEMIQAFKAEMERVQAVMDSPDATPEVVAKGKAYTAALFNLINVTAGIVHEQQSALYAVMRGPL